MKEGEKCKKKQNKKRFITYLNAPNLFSQVFSEVSESLDDHIFGTEKNLTNGKGLSSQFSIHFHFKQ